jgi:hypothetical protein
VETALSWQACRLRAVPRAKVSINKNFPIFVLEKIPVWGDDSIGISWNVLWQ